MENQRRQEIIRSRIEQIRAESPWMEEYEIEAIVCTELDIDQSTTPDKYLTMETAMRETRPSKDKPVVEPAAVAAITKDYSEIKEDTTGKYGAYEAINRGAAQRKDLATRALYQLTENAATAEKSSAILEKARAAISKNIKKEVSHVSFSLLLFVIIEVMISIALVVVYALTTYNTVQDLNYRDVYDFITSSTNMALLHAGMLLLGLGFPFVAYVFTHKLPLRDMVPLHKLRKGELMPMFWMGLGMMTLDGCFVNYFSQPSPVRGAFYDFDAVSFGTSPVEVALTVACLGIVPALIETFVFNGVILQVLRRRGGDSYALLFSGLLYAILTTNFVEMPGAFLSCMWLGYMVIFSGSLLPAALVRLVERILYVVITQIAFSGSDIDVVHYIDCFVSILILVFAIFSIRTMLKRFPEMFVLKKSDPCLTVGQKVRVSFSRVAVIILIIYSVTFSLLQLVSFDSIISFANRAING